nr:hypothetical protein [Tanacetum cinerariifolium]
MFTLKIHHSGRFTCPQGRIYRLGEMSYVDLIDYHLFCIEEYVAMSDELLLRDGRLLFSHFKIPSTSLDDGLISLMKYEDVVKFLEYMLRFKEVDVCVKEDVSLIEQHMIEVRFRNEHSYSLLIKEIVQELDEAHEIKLELKDEIVVAKIFADLDEAFEEDANSHLDETLVLEEVGDLGMFDNSVEEPNEVDI